MADQPSNVLVQQRLPMGRRFAFGVGHVLNDLCSSIWFSYLLVYYHNVIKFSNSMAGNLMLVGQVADAISTPFIGYEMDRTKGFCGYGKRKSWHLLGTFCVVISFPFLFMECFHCSDAKGWALFVYYAPFVVIFQFGWAATQIAHLALIPNLTPNENERVGLNAIRYAFTVISSITVYTITWLLLGVQNGTGSKPRDLTSHDAPQFRSLALIVVGTGVVFSAIFHIGTREPCNSYSPTPSLPSLNGEVNRERKMRWKDWLKEKQFYLIAVLYMTTRLVVNLSQVYLPMFITDSLKLDKMYIAIVPLVVYVSGFLGSVVMKPVNKYLGRKITYFVGGVFVLAACAVFWFTKVFAVVLAGAVMLGIGCSVILVTCLSFTADLIGNNTVSQLLRL